jgi:hypothetical protein
VLEEEGKFSDFALFSDFLGHINKLHLNLQGKNQFPDKHLRHLKAFKTILHAYSYQISKSNLSIFLKLQSLALSEGKSQSYESQLKNLLEEFGRLFQVYKNIETYLNIFATPLNVNCEEVNLNLQLQLTELQCDSQLKNLFQHLQIGILQISIKL